MRSSLPQPMPKVLFSSAGRGWKALGAELVDIPRGLTRAAGRERHTLGMHVSPPVHADCRVGGTRFRRLQKPGDIGLVPAGMDGVWEDDADCRILRLSLLPSLLDGVAEDLGKDAAKIDLTPWLQLRDTRIEAIGWAIKADLEADVPSDPLYIESLAHALSVRLIEIATGNGAQASRVSAMPARRLRLLMEFIETNLDRKLHLAELATVAGVSVTRLKTLFRGSTGTSVHQYVIRRRIEHARALIATTRLPASEVALAAGFAHQSHMASTMRRILGQTPSEITRPPR
jgi:AraC family transcriptional regulator